MTDIFNAAFISDFHDLFVFVGLWGSLETNSVNSINKETLVYIHPLRKKHIVETVIQLQFIISDHTTEVHILQARKDKKNTGIWVSDVLLITSHQT